MTPMRQLLKLALQKPELAAALLLALLVVLFQATSNGYFLSYANMRGLLGFLPEAAIVAVGVTLLMICGEFDLSVGSVFALMPMSLAVLMTMGWGSAAMVAVLRLRGDRLPQRLADDPLRHPLVHHHARHALHGALADRSDLGRLPAAARHGGDPRALRRLRRPRSESRLLPLVRRDRHRRRPSARADQFHAIGCATGGFLPAAEAMGIPTARVKITCFIICSVLAGFAGMIQVLRLGSPLPSIGEGLELQAVAAAVIGGVSLLGGIGSILGGIIGGRPDPGDRQRHGAEPGRLELVQVRGGRCRTSMRRQCLAAQARPGDEGGA